MKNYDSITRQYDSQCSQQHEHRITVSFEVKNKIFTIYKEYPATEEDWEAVEEELTEFLARKNCGSCNQEVKREELVGFEHDYNNPYGIERPICKDCWKEHPFTIENNEHSYSSLEDYLEIVGLIGNEEKKNCPVLPNYPKRGKEKDPIFNEYDLQQIAKFKKEINIEFIIQKHKLYGNLTDQQKFFILEYLCYERDILGRSSPGWAKFQVVIENLRNVYRLRNDYDNTDKYADIKALLNEARDNGKTQGIEKEMKEILTKKNCYFCKEKVNEASLAGFEHEKDQILILGNPICQTCWNEKASLREWDDNENFSSIDMIKKTDKDFKEWIKKA